MGLFLLLVNVILANVLLVYNWNQRQQVSHQNSLLEVHKKQLQGQLHALTDSVKALELPLGTHRQITPFKPQELGPVAAASLVDLQHTNQQYELTVLTLESRIQGLLNQQTLLNREVEDLHNQRLAIQPSIERLHDLLGISKTSDDNIPPLVALADQRSMVMFQLPSGWPVQKSQRMTSAYGYRMHPIEKVRKLHRGVDLACRTGHEIYTTAPGVVTQSHYTKGFGHLISVTHNYGFRSRYAHLSKRDVKVGDWVGKHQRIGYCGKSGLADGPHLHYEIRYLGVAIDPQPFLQWQLSEFEHFLSKTGKKIPWQSLIKQMFRKPLARVAEQQIMSQ
ncbi:MAG TPA: hypothetical protein DE179_13835 [Oceanospirillaceae bacterium]|nr:hypothetical protein [Oceanospirillaceae bacterium]